MKQAITLAVRKVMRQVARVLQHLSGGRITPNSVTWSGLVMHVPIAFLIATGHLLPGAVLLVVFGLFDTLDGELARLQNKVSDQGGFLDASTDRFKEVLLYSGLAYLFALTVDPRYSAIAVLACGASICVSFVKAKGESIVSSQRGTIPYPQLNRMFGSGLFPFEVRMFVLVVGLIAGSVVGLDWLVIAVAIVGVFAAVTAVQRLVIISRSIR